MNILRTSLEIDRDLLETAIALSNVKTKKGVIEIALAEFIEKRQKKNLMDIKGSVKFMDGHDHREMRSRDDVDIALAEFVERRRNERRKSNNLANDNDREVIAYDFN